MTQRRNMSLRWWLVRNLSRVVSASGFGHTQSQKPGQHQSSDETLHWQEVQSGDAVPSKEPFNKLSALRLMQHVGCLSEGAPNSAFGVEPEANCPSPPAPDPCEVDVDEPVDFAAGGMRREAVPSQHAADIIPDDEVFDTGQNETRLDIRDWSANEEPWLELGAGSANEGPRFRPSLPLRVEDFEEVD